MKRCLLLTAVIVLMTAVPNRAPSQNHTPQYERLKNHVYILASDSLRGRAAGSDDGRKAASYIIKQFSEMGLPPYYDGYCQYFKIAFPKPVPMSQEEALQTENGVCCNVIGYIEGCDSALKNEYIVIGAHYDHLGVRNNNVYNGADDNASGTAAVIEVARNLMERRDELKRSVLICAFDAEEIGLIGSTLLANELEKENKLERVKLMMSVDMVGWLKGKALKITGSATLKDCEAIIAAASEETGNKIKTDPKDFETSIFTATDTGPFKGKGVATLAITTGTRSPYHKPEDDADLIDYKGLDQVTTFLSAFTAELSDGSRSLERGKKFERHIADKHRLVDMGISMGVVMNNFIYDNNKHFSRNQFGFGAGLASSWNLSDYTKLMVDASYALYRAPLLDTEAPFGDPHNLHQHALSIPVMLCKQFNLGESGLGIDMAFYIGIGGYYNYVWGGNVGERLETHQYGLQYTVGYRSRNIAVELTPYRQLNSVFNADANHPKVMNGGCNISFKRYF